MANIVDAVEMLKTKTLLPTVSSTATPTPLPTVVPDLPVFQSIDTEGTRTLWVVFIIMLIASIIFTGMSWRVPVSKRLFHVLTTLITIIAAISYYAMATGNGVTWRHIEVNKSHKHGLPDVHRDIYRQVLWPRYVDWALTTPLLLIDLFFLAGANGATIFVSVVADIIMILTGLFAAVGKGNAQSWGWYAIACIAYLVIIWNLVLHGRSAALEKGSNVSKFFTSIGGFTLLVWTAYPVIWGVAEGGRHLSVDGEIIAYAVLDILAKPVFGLWLLIVHSRMPESNVEITGFWTQGLSNEGRIRLSEEDGA